MHSETIPQNRWDSSVKISRVCLKFSRLPHIFFVNDYCVRCSNRTLCTQSQANSKWCIPPDRITRWRCCRRNGNHLFYPRWEVCERRKLDFLRIINTCVASPKVRMKSKAQNVILYAILSNEGWLIVESKLNKWDKCQKKKYFRPKRTLITFFVDNLLTAAIAIDCHHRTFISLSHSVGFI